MVKIVKPKFLTSEVVAQAIEAALNAFPKSGKFERKHLHITVLAQSVSDLSDDCTEEEYVDWLNESPKWFILKELSLGKGEWKKDYQNFARCKDAQVAHGLSDGGRTFAHTKFTRDTPYFGAARKTGVIVAVSGLSEIEDRQLASNIATRCIKLAHQAYLDSDDHKSKNGILS